MYLEANRETKRLLVSSFFWARVSRALSLFGGANAHSKL